MTLREQQEYTELRATIRERGTARVWIFVAGFIGWAAVATAIAAIQAPPVAAIVPLLVLAATFEAVLALHVGVERIGRYLQAFYEEAEEADPGAGRGAARWETAAMRFGAPPGVARTDALFVIPFVLATLGNVVPALPVGPTRAELVFLGGAHALFLLRLAVARRFARRQRAIDLDRFRALKKQP